MIALTPEVRDTCALLDHIFGLVAKGDMVEPVTCRSVATYVRNEIHPGQEPHENAVLEAIAVYMEACASA